MKSQNKPKLVLITGLNNQFIAELIIKFKGIKEVDFKDVVYWHRDEAPFRKLKKNIKKHGIVYIPYRLIRFVYEIFIKKINGLLEKKFLYPKVEENLYSACSHQGINIHKINDIHSKEGIELVRFFNCDILAVCGTGILRQSIFKLPSIGTINLHQGEAPKYRGAPPGFWELWNDEKQAGVTIHFVDEGVDTGDIIFQKVVPIFKYDNLSSINKKLVEVSLSIYPEAVRQVVSGSYTRIKQQSSGKQYYFPTLKQRFQLFLKIKKRQFDIYLFFKNIAKKIVFPFILLIVQVRDFYLHKRVGNIFSVLYYHRVTNICQDGITIDVESFEKQIRFLKKHYQIISPADFKRYIDTSGDNLKWRKGCLITFDDGYEDNYINALPILKKYLCSAIFFVSTDFIGNERQFEHDGKLQPEITFKKMTWEQLQDANRCNIEIGIHTDTHVNLGKISFDKSVEEIETSIKKYENHLKRKPIFMSYPFGKKYDITQEVVDYIRNHKTITALFSAYGGKNIGSIDKYDIKRINIGSKDRGLNFWYKVEGGFRTLLNPFETR